MCLFGRLNSTSDGGLPFYSVFCFNLTLFHLTSTLTHVCLNQVKNRLTEGKNAYRREAAGRSTSACPVQVFYLWLQRWHVLSSLIFQRFGVFCVCLAHDSSLCRLIHLARDSDLCHPSCRPWEDDRFPMCSNGFRLLCHVPMGYEIN